MATRKEGRAAALVASGVGELQQGRTEQARLFCEQALKIAPRNPDALHLLGVIALQKSDHAQAVGLLQRAVAIRPDDPAYRCNLAHAYVGLKRLPEALAAFERAARLDPRDPVLQVGLGNCLGMLGRSADAEAVFRRLLEHHPDHGLVLFNLARSLDDQGRHEEALGLYRRVTRLAPQLAEAHNNLGVALSRFERYEEAEQALRACIGLKPDFLPAYASLAIVLNDLRRPQEAEALCRQSLARDPNQQIALSLLGKSLALQDRWQEAIAYHRQATALNPQSAEAHGYLGDALARTGRLEEALTAFDRAISLDPGTPYPRHAKAFALFAHGRIGEGAAEYRYRDARQVLVKLHPAVNFADTLPPALDGRKVCLVGEQGLGDELFFLRYAPLVKALGARVACRANPKIAGILGRCVIFDEVVLGTDPIPAADHVLLVGDLPLAVMKLGVSEMPPPLPLAPQEAPARHIAAALDRLGPPPYIGLTWRAGTVHEDQRGHAWLLYKEIPLEALATALRGVEGTLLSLQRNPRPGETDKLAALAGRKVHDYSATNDDLEEMLALLAAVDEYAGVSNTNTHLRASAGRPSRVLVPWPAEWRWMAAGEASPWFPGSLIYRQQADGSWEAAVGRLRDELIAARPGNR